MYMFFIGLFVFVVLVVFIFVVVFFGFNDSVVILFFCPWLLTDILLLAVMLLNFEN